jgi:hypothetical protein
LVNRGRASFHIHPCSPTDWLLTILHNNLA